MDLAYWNWQCRNIMNWAENNKGDILLVQVFLWIKRWGTLGKTSNIESVMSRNRRIHWKSWNVTHKYLIFLFIHHFLLIFHVISRKQSWHLINSRFYQSNGWGTLGESVCHRGSYFPKQVNPLQNFNNHAPSPNIFISLIFFINFHIISRVI